VHELLRQYAAEHLGDTERAAVESRHAAHYLAFLAARERRIARDEPRAAAAEVGRERDNLRLAWAWAATHAAGPAPVGREALDALDALDASAYALWQAAVLQGSLVEDEQLLGTAADRLVARLAGAPPGAPDTRRARAIASKLLAIRGSLLIYLGRHDQALTAARAAIALGQTGDAPPGAADPPESVGPRLEGLALGHLVWGQALRRQGQSREAVAPLEAALRLVQGRRTAGLPEDAGGPAGPSAAAALRSSEVLSSAARPPRGLPPGGLASELLPEVAWSAHSWLGSIAANPGHDYALARDHIAAGLRLCQALGKAHGEATLLSMLATIAAEAGDYAAAEARRRRSATWPISRRSAATTTEQRLWPTPPWPWRESWTHGAASPGRCRSWRG
jgi:tetratricopeptide (TPR) repeat protein